MALNELEQFADDIWIADGPPVPFLGFEYSVRMTVIRLSDDQLFVHSPIAPVAGLMAQVDRLGEVKFIVSPNKIHHLYMGDWKEIYQNALMFASPGLIKRREDLNFDGEISDDGEYAWTDEIDQLVFDGSRAMREVVFFHCKSRTLILADLIENFDRDWFTGWKKLVARFIGILQPDGRAPLDYRLTFTGRKSRARKSLARIKAWAPENIIIAHGACYKGNAGEELDRAFRWI